MLQYSSICFSFG